MVVLYHRLIKNAIGLDNNFFIRRVFPSLDCGGIPSTISALRKKLPGFHRLSARRFGTQRSSFLPSSIRPVYGCARIPNLDMRFCENRAADSVLGYYCALANGRTSPSAPSSICRNPFRLMKSTCALCCRIFWKTPWRPVSAPCQTGGSGSRRIFTPSGCC